MSHPLAPRLDELTDDEIVAKLGELYAKFGYASRYNKHLADQIFFLIDDYNNEMMRRNAEQDKKIQEELGEDFFGTNIDVK